jgi:imidazoleglycerol phosphate dehydratase HisB
MLRFGMISYLFITVLQSIGTCLKLQIGDQKKIGFRGAALVRMDENWSPSRSQALALSGKAMAGQTRRWLWREIGDTGYLFTPAQLSCVLVLPA